MHGVRSALSGRTGSPCSDGQAQSEKITVIHLAGLAECRERLKNLLNAGTAGWFETRRDLLRGLERSCAECIFDDAELIGESGRPGLLAARGGRSFNGNEATECLLYRRSVGCLEFWPEPSDQA